MSEREVEVTIAAIDAALKGILGQAGTEVRTALYGARDALEIELKRVRARSPAP